ncbi:bifunctional lytic transglycosylase/C40 family peptidase [Actinocorallia sp. A-T 12471]|uniref:C40 family peptidase n=1 Tax=Actinocorallia sp. A-T 12471 TaxID=3089813 RepID=UPI0029CC78E3|nr:bifunctional lytic transglycosylase/C40 family peptidase [Actinocorallia sp. A-T 12471]MDX6738625.1 bifunctional lytic transglycosylase/C40 family peptidase [Actinocorallia sp. A-T 12471]
MRRRLIALGAVGVFGAMFFALLVVPTFFGATQFLFGGGGGNGNCVDTANAANQPTEAEAAQGIPADYLALYKAAGEEYGIPWNVLAGVGRVETIHGTLKGDGVLSGENYAGAGGPMQFLQATWNAFGVDGDGDGDKDRYDPRDAIPGAAAYLKHNKAPEKIRTALFMYNHSWDYVDLVLEWADKYASGDFQVVQNAALPDCKDTEGLPAYADDLVKTIIDFALAQRGKPYIWGGTGPDGYDCSGLLQMAYKEAGLTIPRVTFDQWPFGKRIKDGEEQPGDLAFFSSGPNNAPGRPGHVGMVIGENKMIVARCAKCDPAIGVFPYRIRTLVGFTRPMANPAVIAQIEALG